MTHLDYAHLTGKDTEARSEKLSDLPDSAAELIRTSQRPKARDLNQCAIFKKVLLKL